MRKNISANRCIEDILNQIKDGREYKYEDIEIDANEIDVAFAIQKMRDENLIDEWGLNTAAYMFRINHNGYGIIESGGYIKTKMEEKILKWMPNVISTISLVVSIIAIFISIKYKN